MSRSRVCSFVRTLFLGIFLLVFLSFVPLLLFFSLMGFCIGGSSLFFLFSVVALLLLFFVIFVRCFLVRRCRCGSRWPYVVASFFVVMFFCARVFFIYFVFVCLRSSVYCSPFLFFLLCFVLLCVLLFTVRAILLFPVFFSIVPFPCCFFISSVVFWSTSTVSPSPFSCCRIRLCSLISLRKVDAMVGVFGIRCCLLFFLRVCLRIFYYG